MSSFITDEWTRTLSLLVAPYVIIEVVVFFVFLSRSLQQWLHTHRKRTQTLPSPLVPLKGISVIVPAYNEERVVVDCVKTILDSDYQNFEVVVVNDGSKDHTLLQLHQAFELQEMQKSADHLLSDTPVLGFYRSKTHPHLMVIDKARSGKGKGDALNIGISYATHELVCVVDADSILARDALREIAKPFYQNPHTVAVGGAIRAGNGHTIDDMRNGKKTKGLLNPLVWAQVIEYSRIFFLDRVVLSSFNLNYIISGAFGLFSKKAIMAVDGYKCKSLAEDMDLTVRIHRYHREQNLPYHIAHAPHAKCWTEVPYNHGLLHRQRARWHAGFLKTVIDNRDIAFSKTHGAFGFFVMPYCLMNVLEPIFWFISLGLAIKGFTEPSFSSHIGMVYLTTHFLFSLTYLVSTFTERASLGRRRVLSAFRDYIGWLVFGRIYDLLSFSLRLSGYLKYFANQNHWGHMERAGFMRSQSMDSPPLEKVTV